MVLYPTRNLKPTFRSFVYAFFLLSVLAAPSMGAEFTNNLDEFLTENPEVTLQRFNNNPLPPGIFANCNSPVSSQSNDDCFSPGFIAGGLQFFVNQATAPELFALLGPDFQDEGNPPDVLITSIAGTSFDIEFPTLRAKVVGFNAGCAAIEQQGGCNAQMFVQVFGDGPNVIGDTTIDVTSDFNTFLGVEYTEPIRRISLTAGPGIIFQGVERVWFELQPNTAPIPTLSEWGMIAAAGAMLLAGAFYAVRRRKAAA